jgi:oligopeptide transport system ATP-binding protein
MGLLAHPGKIVGGSVTFEGEDILAYTEEQKRDFRGKRAGMIFQNPMTCLNPVYTIGDQLMEAILCHDKIPKEEKKTRDRDA